jgi:hypothetical protein
LHRTFTILVFTILLASVSWQCRKDSFTNDPGAKLSFSRDTVLFDTIFNTIGSTTSILKVYNRNNRAVRVSSIILEGGENSQYRMNVNGLPGVAFTDIEILGGDSIFVFVEVTVDPSDSLHPFVEDRIKFVTNGNEQRVLLLAWGWDAIFYTPNVYPTNGLPPYRIINTQIGGTTTWTNEKPVVIYGYAVVDESTTLIIEAGTRIYFHAGSGLWVYKDARIEVNGTLESPVIFQGDRLESFYQDQPGQWDRIWINEGPEGSDNIIRHAIIRNSFIGLQLETLPFGGNETAPTSSNKLILENTRIYNTSVIGVLARNYRIHAQNNLFYNSGEYVFAISGGGEYNFDHCTFANYWPFGPRQTPSIFMTNAYVNPPGVLQVRSILNTTFSNCIMYGNAENELQMEFDAGGTIDITFKHTMLRYNTSTSDFSQYFGASVFVNENPGYENPFDKKFNLTSGSFAINKGSDTLGVLMGTATQDINGNPRTGIPDIGCFEY